MNKYAGEKIIEDIVSKKFKLSDFLEHPFSKIAMSLGELVNQTNKKSIKYVKGCVATIERNMPKIGRWNFSVKCNEPWSQGPYTVRVKLLKQKGRKTKGILGREIEISCTCNAWQYNGADYNSLTKDYNERQMSDGSTPDIRDPKRKYLICKHVAACAPLFKKFIIPEGF